jgi:hypothetical protein
MVTPEVVVLMSMTVRLAAARDRRFSIPDRPGHLLGHARRRPRRRARRVETPADGDMSLTLISAFATRATCGTADKQAEAIKAVAALEGLL